MWLTGNMKSHHASMCDIWLALQVKYLSCSTVITVFRFCLIEQGLLAVFLSFGSFLMSVS